METRIRRRRRGRGGVDRRGWGGRRRRRGARKAAKKAAKRHVAKRLVRAGVHADVSLVRADGTTDSFAVDRGKASTSSSTSLSLLRADGKTVTVSLTTSTIVRGTITTGRPVLVFSRNGVAFRIAAPGRRLAPVMPPAANKSPVVHLEASFVRADGSTGTAVARPRAGDRLVEHVAHDQARRRQERHVHARHRRARPRQAGGRGQGPRRLAERRRRPRPGTRVVRSTGARPARGRPGSGFPAYTAAGPRSSADRAADFESACGGSTPPGAIARCRYDNVLKDFFRAAAWNVRGSSQPTVAGRVS